MSTTRLAAPLRRIARGAALASIAIVACGASQSVAAVRPATVASKRMVVVSDAVSASAALEILRAGGNAVDAAVAAGFALAVTHPQAGNIGGGGFMLVRMADGRSFVVDYRETAPAAARRDMFLDPNGDLAPGLSTESWLAVGVPGTVAGLAMARDLAGSMPLERLLAPAVALAERGFPVPDRLASDLTEEAARFRKHPESAAIFLPGGEAPRPGSVLVQKDLARTLRLIAREGPRGFYEGAVASAIETAMKANGGLVTREDLSRYRAVKREPIQASYRGLDILTAPPPSAGGATLVEMLHMLEPFDLGKLGWGSSAYIHVLAEVMKRGYADRATFYGDPDFVKIPLRGILSMEYARDRMSGFDPEKATAARQAGPGEPSRHESEQTTHFTIADDAGNVVCNTYTLNDAFGMGAVVPGLGFLINNEMDDFSARPGTPNLYGLVQGEANAVGPGRRMLSSMTPTILLRNGRPFLALGSPGGGRITTMLLQVILDVVDFGMEIQEAVDAPRCHHQWQPDRLFCERGALPADVLANLLARGHQVAETGLHGDVQAILFEQEAGLLRGASDARGYGAALGD